MRSSPAADVSSPQVSLLPGCEPSATTQADPVAPQSYGSVDRHGAVGSGMLQSRLQAEVRRSHYHFSRLVVGTADILGLVLAITIAHGLHVLEGGNFSAQQLTALWPLPVFLVIFLIYTRSYALTPPHAAEELRRLTVAITMTFLLLISGSFFLRTGEMFSRLALVGAWLLTLFIIPLARYQVRVFFARRSWWCAPVVICGAGATGAQIIAALKQWPSRGLRPVLVLDDDSRKFGTDIAGVPVAGPIGVCGPECAAAGIRHLLIAMPGASADQLRALWTRLGPVFPVVMAIPGTTGVASIWVEAKDIGGQLALELNQSLLRPSRRLLKRTLDIMLVVLGGVVVVPVMLLIALMVRCTSRGPIFFSQQRVGRGGVMFPAWKFRSMRLDAAQVLAQVLESDAALRQEWERDHKLRQDPRITTIGRMLRRTSLDELPQFWNVLIGQMSLVGPRPVTVAEVEKYGDSWELYLRVRPGLTGLWQVSRRCQTSYDERVAMDSFYVHNWSPWLDLIILVRTAQTVVRGDGAY